jgi:upstream activation factor subunit UAF30
MLRRQAPGALRRRARRLEAAGRKVIAGAEAKKLMPHWANGNDYISRDYVKLDQSEYIGGRYQTPAALLGKDYQAVVIQHPLTGKPIEVAPRSTVAAAAAKRTRQSNARPSSGSSRSARPAAAKPLEPDITELVAGRVVETLIKKPIALDRAALLYIADAESDTWDSGVPDTLCKAFKLPSAGRLRLEKLGDKDLARFIVLGTVHNGLLDGYGSCVKLAAQVCKRHKLDPKKIEKQIRGELKEKAAAGKVTAAAKSSTPTWADKAVHSRGAAVSFTEKYIPSLQLAAAVGPAPIMRTEVTKKIWGYIKKHGLQDKKNKRMINADEKLQPVFGGKKQLSMFEMTKYLSQHLGRKRQAKASAKAKGKKK